MQSNRLRDTFGAVKPIVAALALFAAPMAPSIAQEAETPAAETPAPPKTLRAGDIAPDGTKVVCRKTKVLGSHRPRKDCRSQAAWKATDKAVTEDSKAAVERFQRNPSTVATGN